MINSRGYFLLSKKRYEKAMELFEFNVFAFPKSGNAHDSLAEAYMKIGDNENAISHYKRALEIDLRLESATEDLKRLGAIN